MKMRSEGQVKFSGARCAEPEVKGEVSEMSSLFTLLQDNNYIQSELQSQSQPQSISFPYLLKVEDSRVPPGNNASSIATTSALRVTRRLRCRQTRSTSSAHQVTSPLKYCRSQYLDHSI